LNPDLPHRNDVESLVACYLQSQESLVDAERVLAGIRGKSAAGAPDQPRAPSSRVVRAWTRCAAGAAAAMLMIGFVWTFRQTSAHADAVKLVRDARAALEKTPIDRAYRIGIELAPGSAEKSPFLAALATYDCRLWTRSDRFWIAGRRGNHAWDWGRDDRRHIWVAPARDVGLDFPPEDVPVQLDEALDLLSFDLETVLGLMATDFDVAPIGKGSNAARDVARIRGAPRSDHPRPRLRSITVEIDERTKIVRQVVVERLKEGRLVGEISFTYERAEIQSDPVYQLAAHLDSDAAVYGPDRRLRRRRELIRFFGSLLLQGE
jgi:hypothetical protein